MKVKIMSFLVVLLVAIFLTLGCVADNSEDLNKENPINNGNGGDGNVSYYYDAAEQKVFYSVTLDAPRACDSFEVVNVVLKESYPVQVVLEMRLVEADMVCATVLTPVTIDGNIELDHEPGSITVGIIDSANIGGNPDNTNDSEENLGGEDSTENRVYCTAEQKAAEVCTMEYSPVCGNNGVTYSNSCVACSSGEIDYYVTGEC